MLRDLEADGYKVAIDERDFRANEPWPTEMERCLKESRFTLTVLSPRFRQSGNCEEETLIQTVLDLSERKRRLIPLIFEQVELPTLIYLVTGIDYTAMDPLVDPYERLKQTLGEPFIKRSVDASGADDYRRGKNNELEIAVDQRTERERLRTDFASELVAQDEFNVAKRILNGTFELENLIRRIRQDISFDDHDLLWNRFEAVTDELDVAFREGRVLWGDALAESKAKLKDCVVNLRHSRQWLHEIERKRNQMSPEQYDKLRGKHERIVCEAGDDDDFSRSLHAAVAALENSLRPHLKR